MASNSEKRPITFTQRDLDIMVDQLAIMTRQNGDMSAQLAQAEAINRRLAAEYAQLKAAHDALAPKGKKK